MVKNSSLNFWVWLKKLSLLPGSNLIFIFRKDEKRQYEFQDEKGRVRRVRHDRGNAPGAGDRPAGDRPTGGRGGRGGRRPPRTEETATEPKKVETPAQQPTAWNI